MGKSKKTLNSWKAVLKNANITSYNACLTQVWLWIKLIGISIVCTLLIPFILRLIVMWFNDPIFPWSDWFTIPVAGEPAISLLPDFLGGMAGILVGFALDFLILDKIKTIRQYVSMLKPLDAEFDGILGNYYNDTEASGKKFLVISQEKAFSEIDKKPIKHQIIDDILTDYENSRVLAQLPDSEVEKILREINGAILAFNEKPSVENVEKIKNSIQKFHLKTAYGKRRRELAEKWCTTQNGTRSFLDV